MGAGGENALASIEEKLAKNAAAKGQHKLQNAVRQIIKIAKCIDIDVHHLNLYPDRLTSFGGFYIWHLPQFSRHLAYCQLKIVI